MSRELVQLLHEAAERGDDIMVAAFLNCQQCLLPKSTAAPEPRSHDDVQMFKRILARRILVGPDMQRMLRKVVYIYGSEGGTA